MCTCVYGVYTYVYVWKCVWGIFVCGFECVWYVCVFECVWVYVICMCVCIHVGGIYVCVCVRVYMCLFMCDSLCSSISRLETEWSSLVSSVTPRLCPMLNTTRTAFTMAICYIQGNETMHFMSSNWAGNFGSVTGPPLIWTSLRRTRNRDPGIMQDTAH